MKHYILKQFKRNFLFLKNYIIQHIGMFHVKHYLFRKLSYIYIQFTIQYIDIKGQMVQNNKKEINTMII